MMDDPEIAPDEPVVYVRPENMSPRIPVGATQIVSVVNDRHVFVEQPPPDELHPYEPPPAPSLKLDPLLYDEDR